MVCESMNRGSINRRTKCFVLTTATNPHVRLNALVLAPRLRAKPTTHVKAGVKRKLNFSTPDATSEEELDIVGLFNKFVEEHGNPKPVRINIKGDATFVEIRRRSVTTFSGDGDLEKARAWLLKMESACEELQCSDQRRIEHEYHQLISDALSWWEQEESYVKDPASITWAWIKEQLSGKFDEWWHSMRANMYKWKLMNILQVKDPKLKDRSNEMMKVLWKDYEGEKTTWVEQNAYHEAYPGSTTIDLID